MLFLRYPIKRWWKVRVERVGIPMLTAIPLLTLPQFIMLQYVKGKAENWPNLSLYEKYNTLVWELVSHLWFLLVLVVLTTVSVLIFSRFRRHLSDKANAFSPVSPWENCRCSFCCWASPMRQCDGRCLLSIRRF